MNYESSNGVPNNYKRYSYSGYSVMVNLCSGLQNQRPVEIFGGN